ncbi:HU family DNA-binding protein [bacterium]|nr:HU family DNA-binding protein [bacterium]
MKYKEFCNIVSRRLGLKAVTTEKIMDIIFDTLQDLVMEDNYEVVTPIGRFYPVILKEKIVKHPITLEKYKVPARKTIRLKAGKCIL